MSEIHPTAIIDLGAELADSVKIGPYCVVGAHVRLGENVVLHSHVVIEGRTTIGARTQIYPFASIGHHPQDLKFKGEPSTLEIGTDNMIREYVTMNPGTEGGGMVTRVGDRCAFRGRSPMSAMTVSSATMSSSPTMSCWPVTARSVTL